MSKFVSKGLKGESPSEELITLGFRTKGLREARAMLLSLTAKDQQKIILQILRKGGRQILIRKLNSKNPYPTGSIKGNAFVIHKDKDNPLGIKAGLSNKYYHYRFIEFGTEKRYTYYRAKQFNIKRRKEHKRNTITGNKQNRGEMSDKDAFILPIIKNNIQNLINFFASDYGEEVRNRMSKMKLKK